MAEDDSDKEPKTDTPDTTPPPSIATLAGGDKPLWLQSGEVGSVAGSQPRDPYALPEGLRQDLTAAAERKTRDTEAATGQMLGRMEGDRAKMERAFQASSHGPDTLPPKWDSNAEMAKYTTPPIVEFGSAGSIFAIMASAFTHTPMINALNGSAAAMNAINAGDREAYKNALGAWKDNTDLAIQRHKMQHEAYQDSIELMKTDMAAGRAKAEAVALRYGDEKSLAFLRAGYDPEFMKLQEQRDTAAVKMEQARAHIAAELARREYYERGGGRGGTGQPKPGSEQDFVTTRAAELQQENPEMSRADALRQAEEEWQKTRKSGSGAQVGTEKDYIQTRVPELMKENEGMTENEAKLKAAEEWKDKHTARPQEGSKAAFIRDRAAELVKTQGLSQTEATKVAAKEYAEGSRTLSANRVDDLTARADLFGHSIDKIYGTLQVLDKYIGAAGVAGKARRLGERVGNIFGSNKTDLDQFMRDIQYLKLEAPRLLTGANGRPLSAEASRIDDIIGGLSLGDTTANTKRSLEEIRTLYTQMRQEIQTRKGGGSAPPAPAAPAGNWWDSVPK